MCIPEKEDIGKEAIVQAITGDMSNNPDSQLGREETTEKLVESTELIVSSHLLSQYEKFAQQIGQQNNPQVNVLEDQDMEAIAEHPTGEIMLKIEEIPLDIFYSPKHRVVVRK